MSATAAFWTGFLAGNVFTTIAILFVLALLHAAKRGDEIDPDPYDSQRGSGRGRGPGQADHGAAPPLSPDGCGND